MATKKAEIRSLHREGLTVREIVARGFKVATVYDAIKRRKSMARTVDEIQAEQQEQKILLLAILKQVRGTPLPE